MRLVPALLLSLALCLPTLAVAFCVLAYADFAGKVVAVADGDTITVLREPLYRVSLLS